MQSSHASLIRKLRKKLRQIETLSKSGKQLSREEQYKVDNKDEIRKELQELLKEEEEQSADTQTKAIIHMDTSSMGTTDVPADQSMIEQNGVEILAESQNDSNTENENSERHPTAAGPSYDNDNVIENTEQIPTQSLPFTQQHKHTKEEQQKDSIKSPPQKTQRIQEQNKTFKDIKFSVTVLEGHHHDICALDVYGKLFATGGRDTSLKLWDMSTGDELKSLGGHDATITALSFLTDRHFDVYPPIITACYDCTLRRWNMDEGRIEKSIYVYSPILCLDYSNGQAVIGTEGGKVEIYDLETGDQLLSVRAHEYTVTAVKFLDNSQKIVSTSSGGEVKVFDAVNKTPVYTFEPDEIVVKTINENSRKTETSIGTGVYQNVSKINCMVVWRDLIIYGDGGYNVKVLDFKKGEVTKVRNNLKEFCATDSLHIASIEAKSYLVSAAMDVDRGDSYINVRSLPSLEYLGTIHDVAHNCGTINQLHMHEIDKQLFLITCGEQLRVWEQVKRGQKRKGSPEDEGIIPCKYISKYNQVQLSEAESDEDESISLSTENEKSQSKEHGQGDGASSWWCLLL